MADDVDACEEKQKATEQKPTLRRQLCNAMRDSLEAVSVPLGEAGVTFYKTLVCAPKASGSSHVMLPCERTLLKLMLTIPLVH
eukprot:5231134-Pleurochrysis_carterae.AAC.1